MTGARFGLTLAISIFAGSIASHSEETKNASLLSPGGRTFTTYCALCHSIGGEPGMFADALKKNAPDLTLIAKRNGGMFPDEKVAAIIRDGGISGHGTMRLLSWGKYFREDNSEERADQLVEELVAYLKARQAH